MKHYLSKYKMRFVLTMVAIMLRQLLLVTTQQLNASVFNKLSEKNIQQFLWVILAMVAVWIVVIGLDAILYIKEENITLDIQQTIREDVSSRIVSSDYTDIQTKTTGTYLSWLNNDINTISQKGLKQLFNIVRGLSGVVFAGFLMIQYHWSLLLATGAGFLCIFYIPRLFDKHVYEVSEDVSKGNETFVSDLEDQLNGYPIYFAFSSLLHFISRIQIASTTLKKC